MLVPERPLAPVGKRIALRVEVRTCRGTLEGVPRLVEALRKHAARATFLFALGADHGGRSLLRAGPRGLSRRIGHRSLLAHHGVKALLYGTVLPGPDIGRRGRDIMRDVRDRGHEVGIAAWNVARWLHSAHAAEARWIAGQMQRAAERFEQIFGVPARVHGAPGWQMNVHAYRLTQRLGFDYCSDTRGTHPFLPVVDAELIASPQIPTTLPTLDELLGGGETALGDAASSMVAKAAAIEAPCGHVYTVRAEFEGMGLAPVFDQMLRIWRGAGFEFLQLGEYLEAAGASLPRHRVGYRRIQGCETEAAFQGPEFLA
jgi:peptidoglycan/xylan/chitin deacetylase (PgdA/CDA1 family)